MKKKAVQKKTAGSRQDFSFEFFSILKRFYDANRPSIRQHYHKISLKILDYNDPKKGEAFLRLPQFEALEMYVFLKEFANNKKVHEIFRDWYARENGFEDDKSLRLSGSSKEQWDFFTALDLSNQEEYDRAFKYLAGTNRSYANYIFALTMGTGKTILMATCIFYEFIVANKHPQDKRFCHNALIFAPDKTVLQSLKEIKNFDVSKILPAEYSNFISTAVKFHYLDDQTVLSTQKGSKFNIVVSNTQKIILKKRHKKKSATDLFYSLPSARALPEEKVSPKAAVMDDLDDILGSVDDLPTDENDLIPNSRFEKIASLPQLGIYVDEAHHAIGKELGESQSSGEKSSLRMTINALADKLESRKTKVVACYNYTGTPYVGKSIMPEVVYAYSLKDAIDNKYLKQAEPISYTNVKSEDFIRDVINDFWKKEGEKRREGMLPKLAFFAPTIDEIERDLRPKVEKVLGELGISTHKVLVNVGDEKITKNDDLREFNMLDSEESEKQFILLVNKGREGWNCRSLFGVALFRKPDSTIFVLQATMRCLRSIGSVQETGHIYLSKENMEILDDELQKNFNVTLDEIKKEKETPSVRVKMLPPPVQVKINRVKKLYQMKKNEKIPSGLAFGLEKLDYSKYQAIRTDRISLLAKGYETVSELESSESNRQFSLYTLVAEIGRYFNNEEISCSLIRQILEASKDGVDTVLKVVNRYNDVLYDVIIPIIYNSLYTITFFEHPETETIDLVKIKGTIENTYFDRKCIDELVVSKDDPYLREVCDKSFNLDKYCFDSKPERDFFKKTILEDGIDKIYFTGMLTHGESDFYVTYIDPESHTVRSYFPDFLIKTKDGKWLIIEVKGDNKIDDPIVRAKAEYAQKMAADSSFVYYMIKGSDAQEYGIKAINKPTNAFLEGI